MSHKKTYVVFRCPDCGFYSLAFERQKTRLCVRCGKTAKINHPYARKVEGFEEARRLVNELNTKASIGSQSNIHGSPRTILAEESLRRNETGKERRKGLLRTFQEDVLTRYTNREAEISELLLECEKAGIPRGYADKLIGELVSSGQAHYPRKGWIRFL
jgi:predicted RNA-binding Zn-ribbon protein involved in translation (DUF1610 family)